MAAPIIRLLSSANPCRLFNLIKINSIYPLLKNNLEKLPDQSNTSNVRGIKKWEVAVQMEMKTRKDKEVKFSRRRSAFMTWNFSSELYAFSKRINEELSEERLLHVFTHKSYIEKEETNRKELGVSDVSLGLKDNSDLAEIGRTLMLNYVTSYLEQQCPLLPKEGIEALCNHLMSEEKLSFIAFNLGINDLVLSADFPVEKKTLAMTFEALIGAILLDEGENKAEKFVLDLVLTHLIGQDIMDIWEIPFPMGMLRNHLLKLGKSEPEPRLLRESGRNTMFAVYLVGLYVDKQIIGQGPGETVEIAIEMAALDALRNIYQITDNRTPFPFKTGKIVNQLKNSNQSV